MLSGFLRVCATCARAVRWVIMGGSFYTMEDRNEKIFLPIIGGDVTTHNCRLRRRTDANTGAYPDGSADIVGA